MDGLVPGRIVYFVFDAVQADEVNRRRTNALSILDRLKTGVQRLNFVADKPIFAWPEGAQAHIGNSVSEGTIAPAMVVAVNGSSGNSNLKVMLDGTDVYWAISRDYAENKTPGTWHWMFDGQQKRYTPVQPLGTSVGASSPDGPAF